MGRRRRGGGRKGGGRKIVGRGESRRRILNGRVTLKVSKFDFLFGGGGGGGWEGGGKLGYMIMRAHDRKIFF